MSLGQVYSLVWHVFFAGALAWVAVKGGRDERLTLVALICADLGTLLHHLVPHPKRVDAWSVLLDSTLLLFFCHRVVITRRWWPLYACAAQLATCIGLVASLTQPQFSSRAYKDFATIWSYALVEALVLGVGLEQEQIREERAGAFVSG